MPIIKLHPGDHSVSCMNNMGPRGLPCVSHSQVTSTHSECFHLLTQFLSATQDAIQPTSTLNLWFRTHVYVYLMVFYEPYQKLSESLYKEHPQGYGYPDSRICRKEKDSRRHLRTSPWSEHYYGRHTFILYPRFFYAPLQISRKFSQWVFKVDKIIHRNIMSNFQDDYHHSSQKMCKHWALWYDYLPYLNYRL